MKSVNQFRYKLSGEKEWSGLVGMEKITSLQKDLDADPEKTLIWCEDFCPNKAQAEKCRHTMTLERFMRNKTHTPTLWERTIDLVQVAVAVLGIYLWSLVILTGFFVMLDTPRERVTKDTEELAINLKKKAELFLDSLTKGQSSEYKQYFNIYVSTVNKKTALESVFGYEYRELSDLSKNNTLNVDVQGYKSGSYHYTDSQASSLMLANAHKVIERFLLDHIRSSDSIYVLLAGCADGAPVTGIIRYKGEYQSFPQTLTTGQHVASYLLNEEVMPLQLIPQQRIYNPELAFLRAFSLTEYFVSNIPVFSEKHAIYGIRAYTESDNSVRGEKYRKVSIKIQMLTPQVAKTKIDYKQYIDWILPILTLIITGFLLKNTISHYDHWQERQREGKPYTQDRTNFFVFLVAFILCVCLLSWFVLALLEFQAIG